MTAGLLVRTPNGDIQLDGQSPAISMYKKTTYTTDKLEYECASAKSIIAVCLEDYTNNRIRFDLVDNLPIGDIRRYSIECLATNHWPTVGTFTVYEFMSIGNFPSVDSFKYGLELYDENNKLIFSSNYPTIKPVAYIQRANGSPYNLPLRHPAEAYNTAIRGGTKGKKFAILINQIGYQAKQWYNGRQSLNYAIAGFYVDEVAGTFNLDYRWISIASTSGTTQTASVGDPFSAGMAIDVTNY
ncbi:hypothetical protein RFH95_06135 [Acinetobacter nosocomialis]|nr:hypothetical protein [Acinetobacter nosocomialis]MBD0444073.1 hypothetical protein [Acinetobacter nosocomialis]MDQ9040008.1 hypothetical protein [Acinetobacter nosocomialis]MDR9530973.1 hypothetical protein [Acinetobacter nosocomialis]OUT25592.1 hypothetical protein H125_15797 [Acinetobacter nosocomialis P020]PSE16177.1 hypothetical protein C7G95_06555 [Acinetobacter nosocomialis]